MPTITYETIEVQRDAQVAVVRLNRPDQRNGVRAFLERRQPEWQLKTSTDMPDELSQSILGEEWQA